MYCLRCGRQVAEGASFCDACAETVAKPLEESPFLSTRIILPARSSARPAARPLPEKKKKKPEADPGKPRRLIAAVVLLSLCCVLLTAACGYGAKLWFDGRREHNTLLATQEENTRLQAQLAQKDEEIRAQQDKVSQVSARLAEAEEENIHLQQEINANKMQGSEIDLSVRELQEENLGLQKENQRLNEENTAYADRVKTLEQEQKTLNSRISALESENARLEEKSGFIDRHVAFIENDGSGYYHSYSCPRFKKQSYWAYSTNLAISKGYEPCPDCQ